LESQSKTIDQNEEDTVLGKLRAAGTGADKNKFTLFDAGLNYLKQYKTESQLRREHGSFSFRYEPCNVGNIRKMIIILPSV
jgi:hypothetical protein